MIDLPVSMLRQPGVQPAARPAQAEGRADLLAWRQSLPGDFFAADTNLQHVLRMYLGDEGYGLIEQDMHSYGRQLAQVVDPAAAINDRPEHHPRLDRWDGIGARTEEITFHPSYHSAGRPPYEAGILALQARPGTAIQQGAMLYLLSQCGEMGHTCPIVCTMGMIRALQTVGSQQLQEAYLPQLLSTDYERKHTASQFLTEVQGGSDVGANDTIAVPAGDGAWRLTGEKWFCSVANADQMLVTARPEGAPAGTRGLGVFLAPRRLTDGTLNGFYIRRLKTKFGTRTMASAEIDFVEAVAYPIGDLSEGIHIVTELVLNTSRWANALGSGGLLRRAYLEALHFARRRQAFGQAIIDYALVAEALAEMKVDVAAIVASSTRLSLLLERMDLGLASDEERAVHRLLVNINKYWTSVQASLSIRRGQEILGGNGAIEDFSIMPRLYRDAVVFESWEGSHNVLCLQALRDMQKYGLHEHLFAYLDALLTSVDGPELSELRDQLLQQSETTHQRVRAMLASNAHTQQAHIRRLIDRLAALVQAVCLLAEAHWEQRSGIETDKSDLLALFAGRYLQAGYDPSADPEYLARVHRVVSWS